MRPSPLPVHYGEKGRFHRLLVGIPDRDLQLAFVDAMLYGPPRHLALQRTYRSSITQSGAFGRGWLSSLDQRLVLDPKTQHPTIHEPDGRVTRYRPDDTGRFLPMRGSFPPHVLTRQENGSYQRSSTDGETEIFDRQGRLVAVNWNDGSMTLEYQDDASRYPSRVVHPSGRSLRFRYENGLVRSVTDPLDRIVQYRYEEGRLIEVVDPLGRRIQFEYRDDRLSEMTFPSGESMRFDYGAEAELQAVTGPGRLHTTFAWKFDAWRGEIRLDTRYGNGSSEALTISPNRQLAVGSDPDGLALEMREINGEGDTMTASLYSNRVELRGLPGVAGVVHLATDQEDGRQSGDDLALLTGRRDSFRGRIVPASLPGTQDGITRDVAGRPIQFALAGGRKETWKWDAADRLVHTVDRDGKITLFEYDGHDNLVQVRSSEKVIAAFEYDASDHLVKVTADDGVTHFERDEYGNAVKVTGTDGIINRLEYDRANRLVRVSSSGEAVSRWEYNRQGNVSARWQADGTIERFTYDSDGRLLAASDNRGNSRSCSWDSLGRLAQITTSAGGVSTIAYLKDGGRRYQLRSPGGRTVTREYDSQSRVVSESFPDGRTIRHSYSEKGVLGSINDSVAGETKYEYDVQHRLSAVISPAGKRLQLAYDPQGRLHEIGDDTENIQYQYLEDGSTTVTTRTATGDFTIEFDSDGRLRRERNPEDDETLYLYDDDGRLLTVTSPAGSVRYLYDDDGRPLSVTRSHVDEEASIRFNYGRDDQNEFTETTFEDGTTQKTVLDAQGRVIGFQDRTGSQTNIRHDDRGRVVSIVDPRGEQSFRYDALNRLTEAVDPIRGRVHYEYPSATETVVVDSSGGRTKVQLDAAGRPVVVTDALNGQWRRQYDDKGRLVNYVDPKGNSVSFSYGVQGRNVSRTTPLGHISRLRYDELGRPIEEILATGQRALWSYHAAGRLAGLRLSDDVAWQYTYDSHNRLVDAEGPVGRSEYQYDELDRLTKCSDFHGKTTGVRYDAAGRIDAINTPTDDEVRFRYNLHGLVQSIESSNGRTDYRYGDAGRLELILYPGGNSVEYDYDAASRLRSIRCTTSEKAVVFEQKYAYGVGGNLVTIQESESIQKLHYDELVRLVAIKSADREQERFEYDALGSVVATEQVDDWLYNADQELIQWDGRSLQYDDAGRLSGIEAGMLFDYNALNQLVSVETPDGRNITYQYDTFGRRISRTEGSEIERSCFLNEYRLATYDGDGKVKATYVPGLKGQPWSVLKINDQSYFPVRDWRGSLVAVFDIKGTVVKRFRYNAYGQVTLSAGPLSVAPEFVGGEVDPGTGLVLFGKRDYSPALHRFTSPDPLGPDKDGSLYGYALSNPIRFSDSTGTAADEIVGGYGNFIQDALNSVGTPSSVSPRLELGPVGVNQVLTKLEEIARVEARFAAGRAAAETLQEIRDYQIMPVVLDQHPEGIVGEFSLGTPRTIKVYADPINEAGDPLRRAAGTGSHEVQHGADFWRGRLSAGADNRMYTELRGVLRQWTIDRKIGMGRPLSLGEALESWYRRYSPKYPGQVVSVDQVLEEVGRHHGDRGLWTTSAQPVTNAAVDLRRVRLEQSIDAGSRVSHTVTPPITQQADQLWFMDRANKAFPSGSVSRATQIASRRGTPFAGGGFLGGLAIFGLGSTIYGWSDGQNSAMDYVRSVQSVGDVAVWSGLGGWTAARVFIPAGILLSIKDAADLGKFVGERAANFVIRMDKARQRFLEQLNGIVPDSDNDDDDAIGSDTLGDLGQSSRRPRTMFTEALNGRGYPTGDAIADLEEPPFAAPRFENLPAARPGAPEAPGNGVSPGTPAPGENPNSANASAGGNSVDPGSGTPGNTNTPTSGAVAGAAVAMGGVVRPSERILGRTFGEAPEEFRGEDDADSSSRSGGGDRLTSTRRLGSNQRPRGTDDNDLNRPSGGGIVGALQGVKAGMEAGAGSSPDGQSIDRSSDAERIEGAGLEDGVLVNPLANIPILPPIPPDDGNDIPVGSPPPRADIPTEQEREDARQRREEEVRQFQEELRRRGEELQRKWEREDEERRRQWERDRQTEKVLDEASNTYSATEAQRQKAIRDQLNNGLVTADELDPRYAPGGKWYQGEDDVSITDRVINGVSDAVSTIGNFLGFVGAPDPPPSPLDKPKPQRRTGDKGLVSWLRSIFPEN